jgi:hypothetical protein
MVVSVMAGATEKCAEALFHKARLEAASIRAIVAIRNRRRPGADDPWLVNLTLFIFEEAPGAFY